MHVVARQDIEQSEGGAAGASAAAHAAALLADERRADEASALAYLPWLVQASPVEALTALKVGTSDSLEGVATCLRGTRLQGLLPPDELAAPQPRQQHNIAKQADLR